MSKRILYGEYHLLGRLNTGGMAEVFLGRSVGAPPDSDLLAVKRMLPRFSRDEEFSTMFKDEARIASRLNHPNICRVVDQGSHQEQLFIVMEFVHGKDMKVVHLRAKELGERIPYTLVAFVLAEIADALAHAHALHNDAGELENLVHRDVSPQNILVSYDGVPKLIDFGVARAKSRAAQTKVGIVKGKFAYMSPEQAMAKELDGRSDIWALGVVFYQLLTGELPFRGASDIDTLRRIAAGQAVPIQEVAPETPRPLVEIINRAMQSERSLRYQNASEFAADCRAFIARSTRTVDSRLLAAYMRRMFQRDYMREIERIRKYQAGADAASLRREKKRAEQKAEAQEGLDAGTLSLAAGYRRESSDVSDLQEIEIEDSSPELPDGPFPAEDPFAEATDTDAVRNAGFVEVDTNENPKGLQFDSVTDENPVSAADFDEPTVQNVIPAGPPPFLALEKDAGRRNEPKAPGGAKKASARKPAAAKSNRVTSSTARSLTARGVFLTVRQITILLVLALAGVGFVAATYAIARYAPLSMLPK